MFSGGGYDSVRRLQADSKTIGIYRRAAWGVLDVAGVHKNSNTRTHTHTTPQRSQAATPLAKKFNKTPLKFCSKLEVFCGTRTAALIPPSLLLSLVVTIAPRRQVQQQQAQVRCWDATARAPPSTCSHVSSQPQHRSCLVIFMPIGLPSRVRWTCRSVELQKRFGNQ